MQRIVLERLGLAERAVFVTRLGHEGEQVITGLSGSGKRTD